MVVSPTVSHCDGEVQRLAARGRGSARSKLWPDHPRSSQLIDDYLNFFTGSEGPASSH